jgi:hypothetical protein
MWYKNQRLIALEKENLKEDFLDMLISTFKVNGARTTNRSGLQS